MRILVVTARLPAPADRGDRLRAGGFVAELAASHQVHVVSFVERGRADHVADLVRLGAQVSVVRRGPVAAWASTALHAWRRLPLQVLYFRSRRMRQVLDRVLSEDRFDVVYVQMFRMAPYVLGIDGVSHTVVDLTDVVSTELERSLPYRSWPMRQVYRLEARRIADFERQVAARADEVWLVAEPERRRIVEMCPSATAVVVPNRFDLSPFDGEPDGSGVGTRIAFVGNFSVRHNLDAARHLVREVLPPIRARRPDATVRLIGPGGERKIRRLARADGVTATGWVDDLGAELRSVDLFVAPLRFCAGLQNKVVEAMAAGIAVVTTPVVQRGLGATDEHLVVADGSVDIATACAELMADPERRHQLGRAGRSFVRQRFAGQPALSRLEAIEATRVRNLRGLPDEAERLRWS